jgi:hypothetical protein
LYFIPERRNSNKDNASCPNILVVVRPYHSRIS